ncbi:MAG: hypothetical protein EBV06_15735 [Planctomycetia bacterium]|nr:hypothetical protein [Planctomycetia bacterium]
MVKLKNEYSHLFQIYDGVKQGGILTLFLFNYFMNDLLNECMQVNVGAKLGSLNVSIIAYCDDLKLISPSIRDLNILLKICGDYGNFWKFEFNI